MLNPGVVIDASVGLDHCAALTATNEVYTWGFNTGGQLGLGDTQHRAIPEVVKTLSALKIKKIVCGHDSTGFLTESGEIHLCGSNEYGQVGIPKETTNCVSLPTRVAALRGKVVTQLAMGGAHCLALTNRQEVYAWGWNEQGKLGLGHEISSEVPALVASLSNKKVVRLATGGAHSLALTEDGKVYSWGMGSGGRLGHGDEISQKEPKLIEALQDKKVINIVCGVDHSIVIVEISPT